MDSGSATDQIPRLDTERLCLRGYEPRDFEPYAAMMADPEVTRYLILRPANEASIRVARALGARRDGTVEFFGSPSDIYRYPP